jgi:RNA recognition motif-containing protein
MMIPGASNAAAAATAATSGALGQVTGEEVKLFVGGLPTEASELDIRAMMAPYGNILDIHVMKPSNYTNQVLMTDD